jgi:hypothetical protein
MVIGNSIVECFISYNIIRIYQFLFVIQYYNFILCSISVFEFKQTGAKLPDPQEIDDFICKE